jgi:hypothetical protein
MEINEQYYLNLLENNNVRKSYLNFETTLIKLFEKEAEKSKKIIKAHYVYHSPNEKIVKEYDIVAPNGLFEFKGFTAFEIKLINNYEILKNQFYEIFSSIIYDAPEEIQNFVLVIPISLDKEQKDSIYSMIDSKNTKLYIWDATDINKIIKKNQKYFNEITNNIDDIVFKTNISKNISDEKVDWKDIRSRHINELSLKFNNDDLVLFVGAGVSYGAKIPLWNELIQELFVSLLRQQLEENRISISNDELDYITKHLQHENDNNPLLQVRYIKKGLKDKFNDVLTNIIYKKAMESSGLIDAISELSQPVRGRIGIKAIVTYNFDDLIERNIHTKFKAIYRESDIPERDAIGIYHVHGFLPRNKNQYKGLNNSLLVFSEEEYHNIMLDSYNWSNLTQLNFLRENTCLFIGLSMTDQNLRRLLHIASKKRINEDCHHYVVLKRVEIKIDNIESNIGKFNTLNHGIQEEVMHELGLNIIWIDDYDELPEIIRSIRN